LTFCFVNILRSTLHRVLVNGQERYSVRPCFNFSFPSLFNESCCRALQKLLNYPLITVPKFLQCHYINGSIFFFFSYFLPVAGFYLHSGVCVTNGHWLVSLLNLSYLVLFFNFFLLLVLESFVAALVVSIGRVNWILRLILLLNT
jgi:hypothetical protein